MPETEEKGSWKAVSNDKTTRSKPEEKAKVSHGTPALCRSGHSSEHLPENLRELIQASSTGPPPMEHLLRPFGYLPVLIPGNLPVHLPGHTQASTTAKSQRASL